MTSEPPSAVPHARLREALTAAGAMRLGEPLPQFEDCVLEMWFMPDRPSRVVLIQHWLRTDRWTYFIQGLESETATGMAEVLMALRHEVDHPGRRSGRNDGKRWHFGPF